MELLFKTFSVKIIPSAPNADRQPNTKESHFVNPFTEVQMSNPTLVCSDTRAVLWGFSLFYKNKQKTLEILREILLLPFKGREWDPTNPWGCGIVHHCLKPVLFVYSSECSFCVKN